MLDTIGMESWDIDLLRENLRTCMSVTNLPPSCNAMKLGLIAVVAEREF